MAEPVGHYKYTKDDSPAYAYARQTRVQRMKDGIQKLQSKLIELEKQENNDNGNLQKSI